jgi:hypothetical protein
MGAVVSSLSDCRNVGGVKNPAKKKRKGLCIITKDTRTLAGSKTKTCSCARKEKKENKKKTRRDGT